MVAAGHHETAQAGAIVLRSGGNAVDAVCGAAFASFVCEPPLTSPMGAGILLHGSAEQGWHLSDFFARMPGLGARPPDLDFFEVEVDFGATTQTFHVGKGAVAVPGALRGLLHAHEHHGRLPLVEVLAPALHLAAHGYSVSANIAYVLTLLEPIMTLSPETFELVSTDGRLARAGDRLTNPGLAHLLESLGRDRAGTLAALDADALDAFGPAHGGLLTPADLERWAPVRRKPLAVDFAGTTVLLNPPPSAGGGLVALGLRLVEHVDLCRQPFETHWSTLAEILRASSAVRARDYDARLGEPGFMDGLLSRRSLETVWQTRQARLTERALGSTTHISVVDSEHGAASLTTSNGEGCGSTLASWGVHANNFLGEEDINPHGFHAQRAGTAMTTMMCPAVVLNAGRPVMVCGSGGSNRIRSAILQGLVNYLGFGRPLDVAIADDRLHVEGSKLWFEAATMPPAAAAELEHTWSGASRFDEPSMFFGGVHAVIHTKDRFEGHGDPRRGGAVCGPEDI